MVNKLSELQFEKIEGIFKKCDTPTSPGCAVGLIQEGEYLYKRSYGMADLERNVPISASHTVFNVGSVSKQFTAMCILLLSQSGQLSLNDNIRKFLPEIPDYGYKITIQHLIHHTSGIRDFVSIFYLAGMRFENIYEFDQLFDIVKNQKELNFKPGEKHVYSNSGYFLLGEIVKRVSGTSLRIYANENVFSPLGMKKTLFSDDFTEIIKNRAIGYSCREEGRYFIPSCHMNTIGPGGIYTTLEDLYKWDQNFYYNQLANGDQNLTDLMTIPGFLNNGNSTGYAFGLVVTEINGIELITHSGGWPGYTAMMIRCPRYSFSILYLGNQEIIPEADLYNLINICLSKPGQKSKSAESSKDHLKETIYVDPETCNSYVGEYKLNKKNSIKISYENGHLLVNSKSRGTYELFPESETRFFPKEFKALFNFHKNINGNTLKLDVEMKERDIIHYRNNRSIIYYKTEPVHPVSENISEYVGQYYSDELRSTHHIIKKDYILILKIPRFPLLFNLVFIDKDEFLIQDDDGYLPIFFKRGVDGKIILFELNTTLNQNIKFYKHS